MNTEGQGEWHDALTITKHKIKTAENNNSKQHDDVPQRKDERQWIQINNDTRAIATQRGNNTV